MTDAISKLIEKVEKLERDVERLKTIERAGSNPLIIDSLHVGGTSDPGTDNLIVDGTSTLTGVVDTGARLTTVGGIHVGDTSDPGTDNLIVDGKTISGNFYTAVITTLNDDTATSFTPPSTMGTILITTRNNSYSTIWGMANFRTTATVFCVEMIGGAKFATTTGALTGTTGVDGDFTVSAHTDEKVYIENRFGVTVSIAYTVFGA